MLPAPPPRCTSAVGPRFPSAGAPQATKVKPVPKEAKEFHARSGDPRTWSTSTWDTWLSLGGMA
ncbi:hypothetical protein ACH4GP_24060 [Streptomyces celluloflavus]|uniref:Uncharacterized protein n=1 Tax=Streptomyces celluloflavus TaxID=58344 RepID=A0ABW7RH86_9ACTN